MLPLTVRTGKVFKMLGAIKWNIFNRHKKIK